MGTDPSFLSPEEIESIGFGAVGRAPRISRHARFYGTALIRLGDEVRIDDFAVLSAADGGIRLEGHNHIAVGARDQMFEPTMVSSEPWKRGMT